ncbi:MAG: 2-hydroxychromene-2-carboxylate isomerase [Pannonibacter sp.]
MSVTIEYFYTHVSPWAYFGHAAFLDLATLHGATVVFRPVNLGGVFDASGGMPLAKRHPVRQAYRLIELQRWRDKRNLPLNIHPSHFPADPTLADCCALALIEQGGPVAAFSDKAFRHIWAEEGDLNDRASLKALADAVGADGAQMLDLADSAGIKAVYAGNQARAVELGVIGSPCYVLDGEPFWGQDRLDLLADALVSTRAPYKPV